MKKSIILFFLILQTFIFSYNLLNNFDFFLYFNNPNSFYQKLYTNVSFFRYLYSKEGAGQESLYEYLLKNLTEEEIKDVKKFISSNFLLISNDSFNIEDFFWTNPIQNIIKFLGNFNGYIITDYNNQEKLINLIKNLFSYDVEYINGEYIIKNLNLKLYSIGGHILLYNKNISIEKIFKLLDDFNSLKLNIKDNIYISFKKQKFNYLLESFQKKYMSKYSDNISGEVKINYVNKEIIFDIESSLKIINNSKFNEGYKIFGDSLIFLNLNSHSEIYNIVSKVFIPRDSYSNNALNLILNSIKSDGSIYLSEYFSRKGDGISIIIPGIVNLEKIDEKIKVWGIEKKTLGNYYYYSIYYDKIGAPVYLYVNENNMIISSISPTLMKYLIVNSKKFSNLKIFYSNDLPKNILYIWYSNINSFFEEFIGNSVPGEFIIINASDNNKFIEKIILR
ncbi:hypothetical protein SAMN02745164_00139 [Marinitoga hydrogenitolerans DSM 16785]|uniref:Uncharacterized protein n=1 Tax=Marinitoga hydrogenitolerans (strain DSM 16785 / JCM 12826 / AT1271) TaxID=1122195 RepID=A0A1M4S988_MARH1|nr:hypothetical protein [Marinitoga hydrogenitolerans]SHE28766.1 hypothetical protein SAMN02745164_00139 [Marinitoga hydrogenitolerans DSM 16785]